MSELYIPVLLGTTRVKRQSIHAAQLIVEMLEKTEGIRTELIDPKDFTFEGDGNDPEGKDPRYTKLTAEADGFFIVTPEYNHSFPGSLKRMLDSELKNYIHKPAALAGVSSGIIGGARAIESLLHPLREMGMVATFSDVHFRRVQDMFDEGGELKDENDGVVEAIDNAIIELKWMCEVLKYGRENIASSYHE